MRNCAGAAISSARSARRTSPVTIAPAARALPRSLLLIDEFQEFFVEEDRISQGAAVLLDRIVRQGRAFGIHVLLGSQTLGGAYTLARATIGQMVIRIALQCNEADAYLIMDQDNPAPRLLSRPGEGIYNDTAGSIEGNSPFQAVWLDDQIRDGYLARSAPAPMPRPANIPAPSSFEGSAPADPRKSAARRPAPRPPAAVPDQARVWLGAPNSIKGPTEAVFKRQSGNNLLLVGQSEERTLNLLAIALATLALQYPRGQARFIILDSTPPGFPQRDYFQQAIAAVPHEVIQVNNANLTDVMAGLSADLKQRGRPKAAAAGARNLPAHPGPAKLQDACARG
jgi:S-DNA-T family DNA segregation ATPase FtsK/SpoIIIE